MYRSRNSFGATSLPRQCGGCSGVQPPGGGYFAGTHIFSPAEKMCSGKIPRSPRPLKGPITEDGGPSPLGILTPRSAPTPVRLRDRAPPHSWRGSTLPKKNFFRSELRSPTGGGVVRGLARSRRVHLEGKAASGLGPAEAPSRLLIECGGGERAAEPERNFPAGVKFRVPEKPLGWRGYERCLKEFLE